MSEQAPAGATNLQEVWHRVTEMVKERVLMPALWRGMEHGQPVTREEGVFVVGFGIDHAYESHPLQDSRNKNVIEQCLETVTGQPLALRVIHGTTMADWGQILEQEREAARLRAPRQARDAAQAAADSGWDGISERLVRRYAGMQNRQLASCQAEFIDYAVGEIASGYDRLMEEGPQDPDMQHRAYTRVLERLSDRLTVPASVIGYLVTQRRRASEGNPTK